MKAVDVMGFAGGFSAGVDQAGFDVIAKREPLAFKGFGVASHVYNMPWLDAQVSAPEDWDLPPESDIDLVYGCPPCSGFSALSFANKKIHGTIVGEGAEINECMVWLVDYAARVKPSVVVLESVGIAFKNGRGWMEGLWERLRERSGVDYHLTHVNMNASLVGGDVIRPRYFMVAHTDPFGVGLEFVKPRSMREVLADLGPDPDPDTDWGHVTYQSGGAQRMAKTMRWLEERGTPWREGTYLADNVRDVPIEDIPEMWFRPSGEPSARQVERMGYKDRPVYSHWWSSDPFATYRWKGDKPYGVVVAAVLDRAVHPDYNRTLTWREAGRFMSLPDDWSLRRLVESHSGAELGKAVPTASGKWIAHWARMSIEGTPGEFAGVQDTDDERIRVISVQTEKQVAEAVASTGTRWSGDVADPDPSTWLVDRKERPEEWWQREEDAQPPDNVLVKRPKGVKATPPAVEKPARQRTRRPQAPPAPRGEIVRVEPARVALLLEELGLSKGEAAKRFGVSPSRINELVTNARPGSWLNEERWPEFEEAMRRG